MKTRELPIGRATRLTYELNFVGGEYSYREEIKYWRSRGAIILKNEVIQRHEFESEFFTIPEAAFYLSVSETRIRRMIFETRELRRWPHLPVPMISRRELDRWIDRNNRIWPGGIVNYQGS